jgi:hypothetical protein
MIRADFNPALSWDWPIVPGKIVPGQVRIKEQGKAKRKGNVKPDIAYPKVQIVSTTPPFA